MTKTTPNTLEARVLLGWMRRDDAVRFLREECCFPSPLTETEAEALWRWKVQAVEALPPWQGREVQPAPLTAAEQSAVRQFRKLNRNATEEYDFLKLDARDLVIHQLQVVTEVPDSVRDGVAGEEWLKTALLNVKSSSPVKWRVESEQVIFELPHGEFYLSGPSPSDVRLQLLQNPACARVVNLGRRVLLINGYHRTWARLLHDPVTPVVFVSTKSLPATATGTDGEPLSILRAARPPLFRDFLDNSLSLTVPMRRKQGYEMRVKVELVSIYASDSAAAAQS